MNTQFDLNHNHCGKSQYRITHEFFRYTRAIHSCTHVIHARCMDTIYTAFLYNNRIHMQYNVYVYSCMYNMSTRCILLWLHLLFQPIPHILVYTVRTLHGYTYRFLQPTYSRVISPPFFVHLTRILQDFNYNTQYTLPNKKE